VQDEIVAHLTRSAVEDGQTDEKSYALPILRQESVNKLHLPDINRDGSSSTVGCERELLAREKTSRKLLRRSYAEGTASVWNSYASRHSYQARREPMFDLVLFAAFALICLYIAYERLSNRL
jgi:hypothetical protein